MKTPSLLFLFAFAFLGSLSASHADTPAGASPPSDPASPPAPLFAPTPLLDLTGKHDFPDAANFSDDFASQLKSLCSLAEFRALPETDRHVYSFDVWPSDQDSLGVPTYAFNFNLGTEGVTNEKMAVSDGQARDSKHKLTRTKDGTSARYTLTGFGNLDWGARSTSVFTFNKPVMAFGVVLRASGDMEVRKFFWPNARDMNGYPVSYTLSDGTVIQLGERELRGAFVKGNTDVFLGIIDPTKRGIVSVTYTLGGLAGNKAESVSIVDLAFVTPPTPAVAPVVSLKSSCDFENPEAISATPASGLKGLASLDEFRFIVGNHRYVYNFDTWPQTKPDLDSNTADFSFDLKGNGEVGEKVTVTAIDKNGKASLTQAKLKGDDSVAYHALSGLGDIGKGAWAEQTFKFEKPVWGFGVTYSSPDDVQLARTGEGAGYPVSYTLTDGTVVNLGSSGASGGVISGKGKTFVGVMDKTDKGISSVTVCVQGTASGDQPVYIDDLAFALAGPPPGDWKLTMEDQFNGDKLDPAHWSTGYTFPDVINNEYQAYVPENVVVANGVCTIKVEQRDAANTDRQGRKGKTQKFASGAFTSYDKFTQTYGYFEARIKMPHARGAGIWPAFWMLPDRGRAFEKDRGGYRTKDDGMGSEIDLFEFMPWWKRLDGLFPIHMGTIWSYSKATPEDPEPHGYGSYALDNDGWGPGELAYPNADTEFHTYGIYWSPQRLIFYLDSKPIFRVHDEKNIPDVPEYFLFNVAMSGNGWGKSPDKKHPTMEQIIGDLPNDFQIDYFRAYSGTLEEAVPASPSDIPHVVTKYRPPPQAAPAPAPVLPPAPNTAAITPPSPTGAPAAPVNSTISTPAQ